MKDKWLLGASKVAWWAAWVVGLLSFAADDQLMTTMALGVIILLQTLTNEIKLDTVIKKLDGKGQ